MLGPQHGILSRRTRKDNRPPKLLTMKIMKNRKRTNTGSQKAKLSSTSCAVVVKGLLAWVISAISASLREQSGGESRREPPGRREAPFRDAWLAACM